MLLSSETEKRLALLIKSIADNERYLEVKKQILAEEILFAPYPAFQRLDKLRLGYITPQDIKEYLFENDIQICTQDATDIVQFYSSESPLHMTYEDFLTFVLPSHAILRTTVVKRDNYEIKPGEKLTSTIELNLCGLLTAEIKGNKALKPFINELTSRYDYNVFDAFRTIDKLKSGYISPDNLTAFLKSSGIIAEPDDADIFIRRLDTNDDGLLSYREFVDGFIIEHIEKAAGSKYAYSEKKPSYYRSHIEEKEEIPNPYIPSHVYETPSKLSSLKPSFTPYKSYVEKPEINPSLTLEKDRKISLELNLYIEQQLKIVRAIEQAKEELILQNDYNLMDGFRVFDFGGKGFITLTEFCDALKEIGIQSSNIDIALLFKRYDNDSDGRLRYSDYCSLINPKKPELEKILSDRMPYHMHHLIAKENYFSAQTRKLHIMLLELFIEYEKQMEENRNKIAKNVHFNACEAYKILDIRGKGKITLAGLKEYIDKNKIIAYDYEILSLLDKYDQNQDGKITLSEFVSEINPKTNSGEKPNK